jgi:hypothetical protein
MRKRSVCPPVSSPGFVPRFQVKKYLLTPGKQLLPRNKLPLRLLVQKETLADYLVELLSLPEEA